VSWIIEAGSTLGGGQQGADSPSISGGAKLRKNMAVWEIFSANFFSEIFWRCCIWRREVV